MAPEGGVCRARGSGMICFCFGIEEAERRTLGRNEKDRNEAGGRGEGVIILEAPEPSFHNGIGERTHSSVIWAERRRWTDICGQD